MKYLLLVLAACGGGGNDTPDAALPAVDGSLIDAAPVHVDDGTPVRKTCTNQLGNALVTNQFGRLDGYLRAFVPPGGGGCNADSDHVHLQVEMNGAIYDVAIDVTGAGVDDVHTLTRDVAMPGPVWAEGFHAGIPTDYIAFAHVHSMDFPLLTKVQMTSALMTELATVNHISVYTIPYGPDGAHLVHRNGNGRDGMIVTQPLSSPPHVRMFSFTDQAF